MIRRFASLMDAVMWAAEQPRKCAPTDCDLDAPCRRHNSAVTLGARLWRRQLRRDRKEKAQ